MHQMTLRATFTRVVKRLNLSFPETLNVISLIHTERAKERARYQASLYDLEQRRLALGTPGEQQSSWFDDFVKLPHEVLLTEGLTVEQVRLGKTFLISVGLRDISQWLDSYLGRGRIYFRVPLLHDPKDDGGVFVPDFGVLPSKQLRIILGQEREAKRRNSMVRTRSQAARAAGANKPSGDEHPCPAGIDLMEAAAGDQNPNLASGPPYGATDISEPAYKPPAPPNPSSSAPVPQPPPPAGITWPDFGTFEDELADDLSNMFQPLPVPWNNGLGVSARGPIPPQQAREGGHFTATPGNANTARYRRPTDRQVSMDSYEDSDTPLEDLDDNNDKDYVEGPKRKRHRAGDSRRPRGRPKKTAGVPSLGPPVSEPRRPKASGAGRKAPNAPKARQPPKSQADLADPEDSPRYLVKLTLPKKAQGQPPATFGGGDSAAVEMSEWINQHVPQIMQRGPFPGPSRPGLLGQAMSASQETAVAPRTQPHPRTAVPAAAPFGTGTRGINPRTAAPISTPLEIDPWGINPRTPVATSTPFGTEPWGINPRTEAPADAPLGTGLRGINPGRGGPNTSQAQPLGTGLGSRRPLAPGVPPPPVWVPPSRRAGNKDPGQDPHQDS